MHTYNYGSKDFYRVFKNFTNNIVQIQVSTYVHTKVQHIYNVTYVIQRFYNGGSTLSQIISNESKLIINLRI